VLCRYDFFLQSPVLAGQMRYECEFDWGGTRIFVSTAIVEGLRCFFIEPRNSFFATPTVYGRYDDEVRLCVCFIVPVLVVGCCGRVLFASSAWSHTSRMS
jgi:hypothetical protein